MKLQLLVIVRHGSYEMHSGSLDEPGKQQIKDLAEKIKPFVSGLNIGIFSSPAKRTKESAEILAEVLSTDAFECFGSLFSDPRTLKLPEALELVRSKKEKYDVIILVTHFEFTERFPEYFIQKELGKKVSSDSLRRGEAWVIGMAGELRRVRS